MLIEHFNLFESNSDLIMIVNDYVKRQHIENIDKSFDDFILKTILENFNSTTINYSLLYFLLLMFASDKKNIDISNNIIKDDEYYLDYVGLKKIETLALLNRNGINNANDII